MNKTKLLAGLAIGLSFAVTGCNQKPKDAAFFEACYGSNARAARVAVYRAGVATRDGGETVAASSIDRALSRAEIYGRYSKETADEFYSSGFDR